MASFNKFRQFVEDLAKGAHNFTSDATCTLKVALCAVAPVATNSVLADLTTIDHTNVSSRVVTGVTAEQSGGTTTFTADDLTLTATGGAVPTFRYVVLFNDDPAGDPLIGWYDYGEDVTLAENETFVINFSTGFGTLV